MLSQQILVGMILVGRLGVLRNAPSSAGRGLAAVRGPQEVGARHREPESDHLSLSLSLSRLLARSLAHSLTPSLTRSVTLSLSHSRQDLASISCRSPRRAPPTHLSLRVSGSVPPGSLSKPLKYQGYYIL